MQIVEVKTFVVGNPPPHFGGCYFVFLKLVTDGGVAGIGEVYGVPFHPHVVARMIEDVGVRHVVGADPFKIEEWHLPDGGRLIEVSRNGRDSEKAAARFAREVVLELTSRLGAKPIASSKTAGSGCAR